MCCPCSGQSAAMPPLKCQTSTAWGGCLSFADIHNHAQKGRVIVVESSASFMRHSHVSLLFWASLLLSLCGIECFLDPCQGPRTITSHSGLPHQVKPVNAAFPTKVPPLSALASPFASSRLDGALYSTTSHSSSSSPSTWVSAISTESKLSKALDDALKKAAAQMRTEDFEEVDLAILFVSSIYETSSALTTLNEYARKVLPIKCQIIGCTTGGPIGPLDPNSSMEPFESEARLSIG